MESNIEVSHCPFTPTKKVGSIVSFLFLKSCLNISPLPKGLVGEGWGL